MRTISMSQKELKRVRIMGRLIDDKLSQKGAAVAMSCSTRTVRRLKGRFVQEGPAGLAHKRRGKPGNRATDPLIKTKVLGLLQSKYVGFGPVFAAEKLAEDDGVKVNRETLRIWMLTNGFWHKKHVRIRQRRWRERKEFWGQMLQFDGSKHLWIAGEYWHLLKFIDDATGRVFQRFYDGESFKNVVDLTIRYLKTHGKPRAVYVDRGVVYKITTGNADNDLITNYHRALQALEIELIHARSPQAKGRVERSFATDQDRLVKELRLKGITTIEAANRFLEQTYNNKHNKKFSCAPRGSDNLHEPLGNVDLVATFTTQHERTVGNDWTIRYNGKILQLDNSRPAIVKPRDVVTVHETIDGKLFVTIRKSRINFVEKQPASRLCSNDELGNYSGDSYATNSCV